MRLGAITLNPLSLLGEVPRTLFCSFSRLTFGISLSAILCSKHADRVIIFPWSARSPLPRCLPTLLGEQLSSIGQCNSSHWLEKRKKKNAWKFSICSHRSFYISRRASQHNCSQFVASCQSYYTTTGTNVSRYHCRVSFSVVWLKSYSSWGTNLLIFFLLCCKFRSKHWPKLYFV